MFVQDFVDVPVASDQVVKILTQEDGELGVWASAAYRRGEQMAVGPGESFSAGVVFEQGTPVIGHDAVVIPIAWTSHSSNRLIPRMEAELVVAPLGMMLSHVAFRGRYQPPLEGLGKILDRLALHKVAEATVRSFLERLGDAICSESPNGINRRSVSPSE